MTALFLPSGAKWGLGGIVAGLCSISCSVASTMLGCDVGGMGRVLAFPLRESSLNCMNVHVISHILEARTSVCGTLFFVSDLLFVIKRISINVVCVWPCATWALMKNNANTLNGSPRLIDIEINKSYNT